MEPLTNHPLAALLLAVLASSGGTLLLNHLLARFWLTRKERVDLTLALLAGVRQDMADLRQDYDTLRREVDDWRIKYFALLEEHTALKLENLRLRAELKLENARLRAEVDLLNPKPALYNKPSNQPA